MKYYSLIQAIVEALRYRTYLELGVYDGSMIRRILHLVAKAVWVDVAPIGNVPGIGYRMTTDQFFEEKKDSGPFDMIFIDADHSYKSVKKDLINSLEILSVGGTIILHDTDPSEPQYLVPGHCNDCHEIRQDFDSLDLMAVTLPTDNSGMTIVRKKNDLRVLGFLLSEE